jgi:hypothetical protein
MVCAPVFAAATFNVRAISNNDPSGAAGATGVQSLIVEVTDAGPGRTLFTFSVLDGIYAYNQFYIDGVYFYDGALLEIAQLINNPAQDVAFSEGASPGHLPEVNLDTHKLVTGYQIAVLAAADADPSRTVHGVHVGESLGVLFNLQAGGTYNDVLTGIDSGAILIGIKAQGFGNYSESFIVVPPVPAPGALLLSGIGIGCLALFRRRTAAA